MKLTYVTLAALIILTNFVQTEITTIKVKTKPDFPEGMPPTAIFWDGNEVGITNPNESVKIAIDLVKLKKTLHVGDTKVLLWKSGLGIKGEVLSGKAKMKKGPTIEINLKYSDAEILTNALDYFPIIQKNLNDTSLTSQEKIMYNGLLASVLNYEFSTGNIVIIVSGLNPETDQVYLSFSYFGLIEQSWDDTLKLTEDHFSGKKPKEGNRAQVFVDHFKEIQKVGVLRISRNGELKLTSIKTEKYKWGTYKKKKKKKKKYILPITFYAK